MKYRKILTSTKYGSNVMKCPCCGKFLFGGGVRYCHTDCKTAYEQGVRLVPVETPDWAKGLHGFDRPFKAMRLIQE